MHVLSPFFQIGAHAVTGNHINPKEQADKDKLPEIEPEHKNSHPSILVFAQGTLFLHIHEGCRDEACHKPHGPKDASSFIVVNQGGDDGKENPTKDDQCSQGLPLGRADPHEPHTHQHSDGDHEVAKNGLQEWCCTAGGTGKDQHHSIQSVVEALLLCSPPFFGETLGAKCIKMSCD